MLMNDKTAYFSEGFFSHHNCATDALWLNKGQSCTQYDTGLFVYLKTALASMKAMVFLHEGKSGENENHSLVLHYRGKNTLDS